MAEPVVVPGAAGGEWLLCHGQEAEQAELRAARDRDHEDAQRGYQPPDGPPAPYVVLVSGPPCRCADPDQHERRDRLNRVTNMALALGDVLADLEDCGILEDLQAGDFAAAEIGRMVGSLSQVLSSLATVTGALAATASDSPT